MLLKCLQKQGFNVFENTLATTVNEFVIKELVKVAMFWTTGPRNKNHLMRLKIFLVDFLFT